MANIVPNIALGKARYYGEQVGTGNAALIVIPVEAAGLESDAVLRDKTDVAAFFSGTTNEQAGMGRKTITAVTVTIDHTNDRAALDCADLVWTGATGNPVAKLLFAYDPDTTTGTDATLIPLALLDFSVTPDGTEITAVVSDFYRATSAA